MKDTSQIYLTDGKILTLYSARGESDEVWRVHLESVMMLLMKEHDWSYAMTLENLIKSNIDNPITYRDQVFWCE